MHFSKAYSQLLLTLPSELQNSAIEYRQLKKLINELVAELASLGLNPIAPERLQQRVIKERSRRHSEPALSSSIQRRRSSSEPRLCHLSDSLPSLLSGRLSPTIVVYEFFNPGESGELVPRLRLLAEELYLTFPASLSENLDQSDKLELSSPFTSPDPLCTSLSIFTTSQYVSHLTEAAAALYPNYLKDDLVAISSSVVQRRGRDLLWNIRERPILQRSNSWNASCCAFPTNNRSSKSIAVNGYTDGEVVIPLVADRAFFRLLTDSLNTLSGSMSASQKDLILSIQSLSDIIAQTSRPASARGKSDLYTWRAIFQLYMEAQIFESTSEYDRGERSINESEARLAQFILRVDEGGFPFKLALSQGALQRFLELNVRLMILKKFQAANAEAARKILKKHAKRTTLPLPNSASELIPALKVGQATASVPHILVVTLTETLMPIVPHIDDYICLICTSIAFKPIRLRCQHFFCVRCLVKMQKNRQGRCPMCRAPTVLSANESNLDHALINFMLDWFPQETKEKAKANDIESTKERLVEVGLDARCAIM